MKGVVRLVDAQGEREFELSRSRTTIGTSPEDSIILADGACGGAAVTLQWDARRSTWLLRGSAEPRAAVTLNGRPVTPETYVPLGRHESLLVGETAIYFRRLLTPPTYRGIATTRIVLDGKQITIGREDPTRSHDPARVDLDSQETTISRNHALIEREGDEYYLTDLSRSGTELNGAAFTRERLVFGDRFRISSYIFEFTGDAIQLIDPDSSGSVVARQLGVIAGGRQILDDVSFNITAGEFIGVLGGSGQGKSTLLNALCGVNPATAGVVEIGGVPITDREKLRAIGIGFVPQDDIVHRELIVSDAIAFSARLRLKLPPTEINALVMRVMDRLGLTPYRHMRVADLSGGQRKRVSIAIELLAKPSVLFLDEPSSGLDPATEEALMTLLQSLTLTKLTIVTTTHVLQKAYLFDRIFFVQGGKLIFAGSTDEARQHFLLHEQEDRSSLYHSPIERIYSRLANEAQPAAKWEQDYKESRFAGRATPPVQPRLAPAPTHDDTKRIQVPTPLTQLWLLAWRQWKILRSDLLNLGFLALQPIAIGILIAWVADKWALRMFLCLVATIWFGCSNGAQQIVGELSIFRRERVSGQGLNTYILSKLGFLSVVSSAQALLLFFLVVALTPLFHSDPGDKTNRQKEFVARVQPPDEEETAAADDFEAVDGGNSATPQRAEAAHPAKQRSWMPAMLRGLSTAATLRLAELFQVTQNVIDSGRHAVMAADGTIVRDKAGRPLSVPGMSLTQVFTACIGLRFIAVIFAALIGVGIGLAVSSLVSNTTQAVLWVPLTLIPQILLGGVVVTVPDMATSVRLFSNIVPSFAVERMMDASGVFGLATPFLTNRTKTPVFLTSRGDKETVNWTEGDRSYSQSYDKVSTVNIAWQNIAVIPERLGQHKQVADKVGEGFRVEYRDTVESRRDVRFTKGTVIHSLPGVNLALLVVISWLAACYLIILRGLSQKQTGR